MNILYITVATDCNNIGFQIFQSSCNKHNIKFKNIGSNKKWLGGNMNNVGGGIKINLLKQELLSWSSDDLKNTIIVFTDSYDVINLSSCEDILLKYSKYPVGTILFSTEKTCWPDSSLSSFYEDSYYLNSGGYIGYANNILSLLNIDIPDDYDDQLYFTKIYLFCNNGNIILDKNNYIFQTYHCSNNEIIVDNNKIYNKYTKTYPCLLHFNGPSKTNITNINNLLNNINNDNYNNT